MKKKINIKKTNYIFYYMNEQKSQLTKFFNHLLFQDAAVIKFSTQVDFFSL